MSLSRRGILFSPSMKEKRIENYFTLPVTIQNNTQPSKFTKLLNLGKALLDKAQKAFLEFLFPKPQINFFVPEPKNPDFAANDTEIFSFYDKKPLKKAPPTELILKKRKKICCTSGSQTDFFDCKKIENDLSFTFGFETVKSYDWKIPKKNSEETGIEGKLTDCESLDNEGKPVKRKVLRRVERRHLGIFHCENVEIKENETEKLNKKICEEVKSKPSEAVRSEMCEIEMVVEKFEDEKFSGFSEDFRTGRSSENVKFGGCEVIEEVDSNQKTTKKISQNSGFTENFSGMETAKKSLQNSVFFENSSGVDKAKSAESNPFLNVNAIKKTEIPYVFGSTSSDPQPPSLFTSNTTPPTLQKSIFVHNIPQSFSDTPKLNDIEMVSCSPTPQSIAFSNTAPSIQPPNTQSRFPDNAPLIQPPNTQSLLSRNNAPSIQTLNTQSLLFPRQGPSIQTANSQSLLFSGHSPSIKTPNTQASCFFTQSEVGELYSQAGYSEPKATGTLFTLPSQVVPSSQPQLFANSFSSSLPNSSASNSCFTLGIVASTKKK